MPSEVMTLLLGKLYTQENELFLSPKISFARLVPVRAVLLAR